VLFYVFLCSLYCLFCDVSCIVCVYMCTEQLPPGGYPIAVKYVSYHISLQFPGGVRTNRHNGMTVLGKLQRCIKFSVQEYLHMKVENVFVDVDELLMEVSG